MGRSNKTAGLRTEQMDNWSRRRGGHPSYKSDAAHQTNKPKVLQRMWDWMVTDRITKTSVGEKQSSDH
ncbi:hypothetical protein T4D_12348 [Trichinella pseudospiralis]|uniref:Uncharacterized protein n=1 Tax=Trichinella pseudospiralis TaxID=6337 RepID=A0A0V1FX21_TRIPS|nr:hypothetical protein T4D_12348 [Trichinella pseudospiralis]